MQHTVWDEITYPFRNANGSTIEAWELISNSIAHFTELVINFQRWDQKLNDADNRDLPCDSKDISTACITFSLSGVV